MALIIRTIMNAYTDAMEKYSDPRVENMLFMHSTSQIVMLLGAYFYFVLSLGPRLMKDRPPFNIDKILIVYNIVQITACVYLFVVFVTEALTKYSFWCEPVDYSMNPHALVIARHVWFYFILKVLDLFDTVFFVLRKKQSQVTFLHVYHHAGMVLMTWIGTKFVAGGTGIYLGGINSVVHFVMYVYYLLSVWDKNYKKSVWWKRHITHLQLIQFAILLIQFTQLLFQTDCKYPKWIAMALIPQNLFMFALFGDFYFKTYLRPKKIESATDKIKK